MRSFFNLSRGLIMGLCLIGFSGCENKPTEPVADASADHNDHDHGDHDHDHGDHDHGDHDHGDHGDRDHGDHDHGDHDHGDHDHGDHDHGDHDHGDHDHGDHDHGDHDHDHGDHGHIDAKDAGLSTDDLVSLDEPPLPDTYNEAVAKLVSLTATISEGFKNGKIDDAHGPLHDVSNLLEGIDTLASKSKMDDDTKKSVTKTIDSLFDSFGAVDLKLHNAKKGKDYADVADEITASIKTLQSFVKE